MKRTWIISLVLSALVGVSAAHAQQRPISGRVTNALTGEGLASVRVSVAGTAITALTGADGSFSLAAPTGDATLVARIIGFKRRQVTVPAGQSTVQIALEEDIFNLEAVVVTGQATAIEQRNLANAVTTVRTEQLNRAPSATFEAALQGKIPGALIQSNSGAPGGGVQINLRGVSTINGTVDPLIVVDGLIISNAAIGNNINAVSAAAAGGNASNQDNAVNRLADLNPADIENVEILKGASAAAIYGSQASNGVVIITTKRGRAGAPRFHLTQRMGQYRVLNVLRSRRFADSAEAVTVYSDSALIGQLCDLPGAACPYYDNIGELWGRTDITTETDLSLSGGSEQTRYYLSGLVRGEQGIAPKTGYWKQAIRANLDQTVGDRVQVSVNTQVIHSRSRRGISNNDNTGTSPYMVFPFTPSFVDLRPTGPRITDYPDNPFERSNPLQTFDFLDNKEDVWRALGSATIRFDALSTDQHSLRLQLTGGLDYFQQQNDIYSPPELEFEPNDGQPGTVVLGKAANLDLNLLANAVHTYHGAGLRATTAAGFQYVDRDQNVTNTVGRNLPPGQRNVDQATSVDLNQTLQPQRDFGIFAQEELLLMEERLLLTLGLRADRSSRNGDVDQFHFYPKAAASYRLTGLGGNEANEVKLRGAWGQTGLQPNFADKYTPNGTGVIGGLFGSFPGLVAGSEDIEPERNTEIEAGIDASLIDGRLLASVTVFNKQITNMLLRQTLAPSTGRTTRVFNGGKLRNRGVEASLGYNVTRTPEVNWVVRATYFANRTKVLELPVPAFQVGGFGTSLGAFQIEEGKSASQIVGSEGVVGDATPDFQMSFSSDLEYRRWSVGMLWDWKKGGDVINLTELLFDAGANSEDWNTAGQQRWSDFLSGLTQPFVQDASYLKLRELAISYHLPAQVTSQLFGSLVKDARVSLAGRNLIRITDFRGLDPEVSNFGNQAIARNIDVAPFPPSRSIFLSIDLDF